MTNSKDLTDTILFGYMNYRVNLRHLILKSPSYIPMIANDFKIAVVSSPSKIEFNRISGLSGYVWKLTD